MVEKRPTTWPKWLSLAKWYIITYSTIKMTPFDALSEFVPLFHIPYFPKDSEVETVDGMLRDREERIRVLKF